MKKGERKSKHHLYWPRKKFPQREYRQHFIWLTYEYHQAFHQFFNKNCRTAKNRPCLPKGDSCVYVHFCTYYMVGGGEDVPTPVKDKPSLR